ncbi:MAG: hypoxanthine-guanine phosphoribosyltransferase [Xanthomonadaceae bacterium]|nr:hypoxanthine-guanine phosphoribosyltransferase [Xanthomonadaceae bacterium]MDE1957884.1 hypoxanthine-guanine phosphoribosyltransferase [Xanthomonadaceae bacterium]MDE2177059.1 hypoxanthine-guanine phosphoribosyltransferase [Xanthomonadaceae bacterium]MDE2246782.1 hypoxanthine-guanine phosphoribosyltransferase [Xanthomonadaceae bacterium]
MNLPATLVEAIGEAERLHDRAAIEAAIARMGRELDVLLAGERAVFLTVMNGALMFAGALALAMRTDLEFDYLHATRYRGATRGGSLHWLRRPVAELGGRTVILADDILDEGHTLAAVRDACRGAGASRVLIAALCVKRHDRCVPGLSADVSGLEVPDRYVFGYGMDFQEQGRNLPAIYALPEGA